jgi:hypothetical protein
MNFHHLSVELLPESFGGLFRQPEKEIYPYAEVRGQEQRGPLCRPLKLLPLVRAVAGCADDHRLGSPGALVSNQNRRLRLTHVNHDVAPTDQFSHGIAAPGFRDSKFTGHLGQLHDNPSQSPGGAVHMQSRHNVSRIVSPLGRLASPAGLLPLRPV